MTLTVGTRLGPYEVAGLLGAGGMGEVYKARDTRLERDVAVKVLSTAAGIDAERLRRFEQEARATAALNHPNILAVFDVGTHDGVSYAVSELLEGETLRDRLKEAGAAQTSTSVPVRKAIDIAAQMARGLAAAHDKGIVHRDLKPENVFLTRDGQVKILDFGLAKLVAPGAAPGQTLAPTKDRGTTPGMVLGTIGYMSPEQVRGVDTDYRTDIFSFGAILYEMLAGRRAFKGQTEADTMTAILTADPVEIADQGRALPPSLDRLVRRCLEKNPAERFQSARDLAFDLEGLSAASHASGAVAAVPGAAAGRRWSAGWIAASLVLGLATGSLATWTATARSGPAAPTQFRQLTFRRGTIATARFSPDGETVVYSAAWEDKPFELYSTRIGAIGERPLGITGQLESISKTGEMAVLLDVRVLANWMQTGTLARAPLGGGAPREILRNIGGADWSPDGQQLVITRFLPAERRWRLEYPVGTVIFETDKWIESPRLARDNSRVLLLEHPISGDDRGVATVVSLKGQRTVVSPEYPSIRGAAWSPSGDEAWFTASVAGNRRELLAARPGGTVRQVAPAPASVVVADARADGHVLLHTQALKARMLVRTPSDTDERDFSWFDFPIMRDMSADGSLVVFDEEGEGGGPSYSAYVRKTDGSPAVRIADGYAFRLSPDRQWTVTARPGDRPGTYLIVPIGPGEPRKVVIPLELSAAPRWFPDGKRLVVVGAEKGHQQRAYEYTIDSGAIRPITPDNVVGLLVSPDGRVMWVSDANGKRRLWPVNGGEPVDVHGTLPQDTAVAWTADSKAIYVSSPTSARTRDIARLDLGTGHRQVIATYGPTDAAGLRSVGLPFVSADGRTYAYRYSQMLSDLFVGSGLK
jgi:Tol biopolymer transport system component